MPELPEVETVRRGLAPHLTGKRVAGLRIRNPKLRWPISDEIEARASGLRLANIARRGKYLLFELRDDQGGSAGNLLVHLGMSGSLRLTPEDTPPERHDHVDILFDAGPCLRLRDPRRFGAVMWCEDPETHPLLAPLGIEPLTDAFNGGWLHAAARGRATAVKTWIMDARRVVGIGNIYANESLFSAGIDPRLAAGRMSRARCDRLAACIKAVLTRAIAAGGSSLRDFVDGHGKPGYFQQTYAVYGRAGAPCPLCGSGIRQITQGGRSSFYCPACQKR